MMTPLPSPVTSLRERSHGGMRDGASCSLMTETTEGAMASAARSKAISRSATDASGTGSSPGEGDGARVCVGAGEPGAVLSGAVPR